MTARPTPRVLRATALLATAALAASGASLLTGAATAAEGPTTGARTDLTLTTVTKPGVAGQYQIAASDDTGDLFITSAQGRPPVLNATLARVDPATLEVVAKAKLPVIPHGEGEFKQLSTHGIYVDDTHDNVWVTNTRDEQVSVYDRDTLEYVGGTYDFDGDVKQQAIAHPREIVIDEQRNLAYVTAANRGGEAPAAVTVYSTVLNNDGTLKKVKDIAIAPRPDYPAAGESAYAVTMGLEIDEATGVVYSNDFRTDEYYTVDPKADFAVSRHAIPNPTVATDGLGSLQPSSIAVDPGAGELYTVNQTQGTTATSLNVFDLETHSLKYSVETGPRALAVDVDRQRGLVYVADFANGSVAVVDARNGGEVIETIQPEGITAQANHLVVAGGSAFVVDKNGANKDQTIDYAVDRATGERTTAVANVDSITKITPAAEAEVVGTATVDGTLRLQGEGWFNAAGTQGSTIALKINKGALRAPDGTDVWATVQAEEDGTFAADVTLPASHVKAGTYDLNLLSGTLQDGDVRRSVALTVTVDEKPAPVVKTLKNTKKPTVKGKAVVGKKLTAKRGSWNASRVTVKFQWLRNGKVIKGATKAKYKLVKKDAKKKISVRVTATADGWTTAQAKSKAVKVKAKKK